MSSRGQSGRPRNAWTLSRKRKLVRLYSLTTLNKSEISTVLKTSDFGPSESDIQKKLRCLLPKDYATDNRKFRPADVANMRLRLQILQICDCKSRHCPSTFLQDSSNLTDTRPRKKETIYEVDGTYTAFRNYGIFLAASMYIPPVPPVPTSISTTPPSQLVDPFLLMLDGSNMANAPPSKEFESIPIPNRQVLNDRDSSGHKAPPLESIAEHDGIGGPKAPSAESLRRRLPSKYSQAYLEHISSVLQYSSPSSLGSSLMSASRISSWKSNRISHHESSPSNIPVGKSVDGQSRAYSDLPDIRLSKGQQNVWNELVDESMLSVSALTTAVLPDYSFMSIIHRQCCKSPITTEGDPSQGSCNTCGFTRAHRLFRHGVRHLTALSSWPDRVGYYLDQKDYFGNTPLHCAAASGRLHEVKNALTATNLASFFAVNTSGETFLHLLHCSTAEEVAAFYQILMDLKHLFEGTSLFTRRDYHGRTILHQLFQSAPWELFKPAPLRLLFDTTTLDIYAADNFGVTLMAMLKDRACINNDPSLHAFIQLETESSLYHHGLPTLASTGAPSAFRQDQLPCFSFHLILTDPSWSNCHLQQKTLISMLDAGMDVDWIDNDGETALTAIVKYWVDCDAELLLRDVVNHLLYLGSEIHLRDRSGNTPLATATARGFRAVVKTLLDAGANIHNRNYAGVGILTQASKWKRSAKIAKDDKQHARIWSSLLLLIDKGAKHDPTDIDEWMSPDRKEEYSSKVSIVPTGQGSAPISISKPV